MFPMLGMDWRDSEAKGEEVLAERLAGIHSVHKLRAIPFLAVQFRDSHRGLWVLIGFLVSCIVLLVLSWGLILLPHLLWRGRERTGGDGIMVGIPVKDYISQGTMFTLCIIGLAHGARFAWDRGNVRIAIALVLLAIAFFLNLLYADVSRTTLVVLSVLLMLFAFMRLNWKVATAFLLAAAMLLALAWSTSIGTGQLFQVGGALVELKRGGPRCREFLG